MNINKNEIIKQIKNITYEEAMRDLLKFLELECKNINRRSLIGLKYLNYYFFKELIKTKSRKGLNYFEAREDIIKKDSFKQLYDYYKKMDYKYPLEKIKYRYFNLYYGSITIFKPVIAKYIYCRFKPLSVLDFSCGWGGRLLGIVPFNIKYLGFDTNINLKPIYNKIIKELNIEDRAKIIFKDSSKIDFSKYDYDFIFTSPPYFNIELYSHMPIYRDNDEYINNFYKPVITNSYKNLKIGGRMVLNIPKNIYEIHKKLFRKADLKIKLDITSRGLKKKELAKKDYEEYIYIWNKLN